MSGYEEQRIEAFALADALFKEAVHRAGHADVYTDIERAALQAHASGIAYACAVILESPEDVLIHIGFMLADARDSLNEEEQ